MKTSPLSGLPQKRSSPAFHERPASLVIMTAQGPHRSTRRIQRQSSLRPRLPENHNACPADPRVNVPGYHAAPPGSEREPALELLALATCHSPSSQEIKTKATGLWATLTLGLPPEKVCLVQSRGRQMEFFGGRSAFVLRQSDDEWERPPERSAKTA